MANDGYGVYLGLDVSKVDHHAVGLAPDGKRLMTRRWPNTEARLRQLFDKLARHGTVLGSPSLRIGSPPHPRGGAPPADPADVESIWGCFGAPQGHEAGGGVLPRTWRCFAAMQPRPA